MESIDELRKWAKRYNTHWIDPKTGETTVFFGEWRPSEEYERFSVNEGEKLCELLDEVEQEHEREMTEQYNSLTVDMQPMTDENMAESGWVRLPEDADGELIHLGDEMCTVDTPEYHSPVEFMTLTEKGWMLINGDLIDPSELRHFHEPTVEDMLTKMIEEAVGYSDAHTTVAYSAVSKYAEKLKKMMNDE